VRRNGRIYDARMSSEPSPESVREPSPKPGDVIFVLGANWKSISSGIVQRVFFDKWFGPLFSHVGMVVDGKVVIEANPTYHPKREGEEEPAVTGASLGHGVRLRAIPDLLSGTRKWVALRKKKITEEQRKRIDTSDQYIATIFGSGYELRTIKKSARRFKLVARHLPDRFFRKAVAAPDEISQKLRDDPEFRRKLEKHLPQGKVASSESDYFCSQLIGNILQQVGLAQNLPGLISPSGLYDRLRADGWDDVSETAYCGDDFMPWAGKELDEWKIAHDLAVSMAAQFRNLVFIGGGNAVAKETMDGFAKSLDDRIDRLNRLAGAEPSCTNGHGSEPASRGSACRPTQTPGDQGDGES
jgi:hypothetical protein